MLADFAAERGHGAEKKGTGQSPSFLLTEFIPALPDQCQNLSLCVQKGGRGVPVACDLLPPPYFPAIL